MTTVKTRDDANTPVSILTHRELEIHIDRHVGDVLEGMGPDGPYHVTQSVPYGYLPDTLGDDGKGYDCYVGSDTTADVVHVVTQCKAGNGRYDEQKAMLGFTSSEDAAKVYGEHTHPRMLGRVGSVSYKGFVEQLTAHREALVAGDTTPMRILTDEDRAESRSMAKLATHLEL